MEVWGLGFGFGGEEARAGGGCLCLLEMLKEMVNRRRLRMDWLAPWPGRWIDYIFVLGRCGEVIESRRWIDEAYR